MLVLLSVFLVAQPLALEGRPGAGAAAEPGRGSGPGLQLTLELRADGSDALNHQFVPRDQLPTLLEHLYRRRPDRPLFLMVAPNRTYGEVLDIRSIARGAGVRVVAVVPRSPTQAPPLDSARLN